MIDMRVKLWAGANLYGRRYENGRDYMIFMEEENNGYAHFGFLEVVDSRMENGKGNAESIK